METSRKLSLYLVVVASLMFFGSSVIAAKPTLYVESLNTFTRRVATANPDDWRFVFMGDNRGNDKKFKAALQLATGFNPVFIIHGGDIVEQGTAEELEHFMSTLRSLPGLPPLFVVRGNHEMNAGLFEAIIGPRNFSLDSQRLGLRLVAVDNSDYALQGSELAFLDKMLDMRRQSQFVAMHIPPKTERWSKHSFSKGKDTLGRLMAERKVKLGLFAHIHLFDNDIFNGVPCVISGGAGAQLSWWYSGSAEYHIVVVEVKKGKVSYRVEAVK